MDSTGHRGQNSALEAGRGSKEPRDSKFMQQELKAWRPVLTPCWVTTLFFLLGLLLVPIGVLCLYASNKVVEITARYDHLPECSGYKETNQDREREVIQGDGLKCHVEIIADREMVPPVYLYYELENFYQNHRRYVKSRNVEQLVGEKPKSKDLEYCEPKLKLNNTDLVNPCGLTAWSFFNDSYTASMLTPSSEGEPQELYIRNDTIAWKSDVDHKFADYAPQNLNTEESLRGGGEIKGSVKTDQHFIVWMRTAAMPRFRKLWGVIDHKIPQNATLIVGVSNRYNTYRFDGRKSVVFSTTTWLGGKNDFLGIAYITSGAVSILCSIIFFLVHLQFPRQQGDERFLSWNNFG